nr:hypothetical protein [Tanacetum cinerariifolium]
MQTQTSNTLHNAIMEAGSKDHLPMLAPGNYIQWKSRIKRYNDTKTNYELIYYCLKNPPYKLTWAYKQVPISKGSSDTTTEKYMETYKNVSQDIHDQLNAEVEAVQIILIGIDNDIYSTVDACPNACEIWKDGESLEVYYSRFYKMMNELIRNQCDVTNHQVNVQSLLQLQPEWQRFVTLVKQNQELKTVSYHKLYDILKQHLNKVNEIIAERIARTANPLALVAQQQPVYNPQNHPTHYTQNSSTRLQQAATKNRGKAIVNSPTPIYDQEMSMVAEDDEISKDKEIDKLMALISLSFKNIYKPTNNNLRTSSNISRANQDNSPRINRGTGECQKPKRVKDAAYHREKMLLCKQEEAGNQLNADEHHEQSESIHDTYLIEQDKHNVIIDSLDMRYDRDQINQNDGTDDLDNEHELLASLIEKLKCKIDDSKNRNKFLETSNKILVEKLKGEIEDFKNKNKSLESPNNRFKEANNKLSETNKLLYDDFKKSQAEVERLNSVDKCQTSFAKPEFLKKAQRANPRLYDIGCYNDNLALMLAPESDEVIQLEKEYEVTNLQCDYLEMLDECECIEKELLKSKNMSKSFETLQTHAISLELELQQFKEKIKNDKLFKVNQSQEFCKEREQYFEIQDLKAQLQDKGIVISELKKLIEKLKGNSLDTKFGKSSVVRQPNAFKSQRQSILVTAQILPLNKKSILKNTNVLALGMYKLHTKTTQTRTSQLPNDSRKTNKRVSFSTGVIPTTSFSRLQLKSNLMEDRVMLNNNQGKKQHVEDQRRNDNFSKNKTSVTACNDSFNAKTLNVNFVCATYGKCVLNEIHDMCVLKSCNGVNSRTKMPIAVLVYLCAFSSVIDLVPLTCVIFEHFIKIIIHSTSLNHPGCGTLPPWFRSCASRSQTEASQSRQSTDCHKFDSWKNLTSHLPKACLMLALA